MTCKILLSIYDFLLKCCLYARAQIFARNCRSTVQLTGKTVIITGGNTGLGKETALDLARRGAKVIIASRDVEKSNKSAEDIREKVKGANIVVKCLDLASFASIRKFCEDILNTEPLIHILINNSGIAACPKSTTEDGHEMQFGVNHLGHFLLANLLLDRIKASAPARIVTVASIVHIFGKIDFSDLNLDREYHPAWAYARSKLANILFTRQLAKKLQGSGVTANCLHPGYADTEIGLHVHESMSTFSGCCYNTISKILFLSRQKGAQTIIHCAVDEAVATESGLYYNNCREMTPSATARNDELAQKLWDVSEKLISSP